MELSIGVAAAVEVFVVVVGAAFVFEVLEFLFEIISKNKIISYNFYSSKLFLGFTLR